MHLAFNCLMFLTYQASDFNNWEKWEILLYVFIILNGRFSFKLNFIPGWNSTRFILGWNSRVNRNFFIPGWDFISITCERTLKPLTRSMYLKSWKYLLHEKLLELMKNKRIYWRRLYKKEREFFNNLNRSFANDNKLL